MPLAATERQAYHFPGYLHAQDLDSQGYWQGLPRRAGLFGALDPVFGARLVDALFIFLVVNEVIQGFYQILHFDILMAIIFESLVLDSVGILLVIPLT